MLGHFQHFQQRFFHKRRRKSDRMNPSGEPSPENLLQESFPVLPFSRRASKQTLSQQQDRGTEKVQAQGLIQTQDKTWLRTVDTLSHALCPSPQMKQYMLTKHRFSFHRQRGVVVFPVWKTYRRQARQLALLYRLLPICRRLPLRGATILAGILMK